MITNEKFFLDKPELLKSCLLAMRQVLLEYDDGISETTKYGMPCFLYNGKPLCYLWTDKDSLHPYFLLVDGNKIEHPALEMGKRKRMKILKVNPEEDLPIETISEILHFAILEKK